MINSLSRRKGPHREACCLLACEHKARLIRTGPGTTTAFRKPSRTGVAIVDRLVKMTRQGGLTRRLPLCGPAGHHHRHRQRQRAGRRSKPSAGSRRAIRKFIFYLRPEQYFIRAAGPARSSTRRLPPWPSRRAWTAPSSILRKKGLRNIIYSAELVLGLDPHCKNYNKAHRNGLVGRADAKNERNGPCCL